ncbi:sigma-54-dependent Fis family transcriptional regulator [Bacillus testis]|uniref:sigma-54-dependent Fis family transcriptional regulator n=1 Tax=Bacillus testis TaxID=1622072 RepID=UPI00067F671D|nr:sigma-54-dependent Fis family transcriptional regulator [Bacillus testis]
MLKTTKAIDVALLNILTLYKEETIFKAVHLFRQHHCDALPIIDENGKLCGIFTRSNIYNVLLSGFDLQRPVSDVMVSDVFALSYNDEIDISLSLGSPKGQVVIVDDDYRPIGMINKSTAFQTLLSQSNALASNLSSLVETMEDGVINVNEDGTIQVFNAAAAEMLEVEAKDMIGKSIDDLFPSLGIAGVLSDGQSIFGQRCTVGEHIFLVHCRMVDGPHGWFGAVAILQDMTKLELLTNELQSVQQLNTTLDTVLELAYDGIVVVNKEGNITMINSNMCHFLGVETGEAIGRSIRELRPDSHLMNVLETGLADINDIQMIRGTRYTVTCLPLVENGQAVGAVEKVTFHHIKELKKLVEKMESLEKEITYFRQEARQSNYAKYTFKHIVSVNPKVDLAKKEAMRVAQANLPVVILGPSGTGKELFAHSIHNASPRRAAPFIKVNCAAIPEELMESEFFGYEEGAFTGAKKKGKPGKFELANGGTLFLDEIGDMSPALQVKLLRVLQDGEFERVGGIDPIKVNVRIIAATNTQLEDKVRSGEFRLDLYYRINVFSITIPPLSERKDDIPHLAKMFINKFSSELGIRVTGIEKEAMDALTAHEWPGNVRELENVIRRAVYLLEGEQIKLKDLPEHISHMTVPYAKLTTAIEAEEAEYIPILSEGEPEVAGSSLEDRERQLIIGTLQQTNGNRSKAAKLMGMGRSTLYEKMNRLGIPTAKEAKTRVKST